MLLAAGTLVTLDRVAGKALKQEAAARFGALAVDMEATGVAAAAAEYGTEFAAIKAISDGAEEDLEFPLRLRDSRRALRRGRFIAHIALRPELVAERGGPEAEQQTGGRGSAERGGRMHRATGGVLRPSTGDCRRSRFDEERVVESEWQ